MMKFILPALVTAAITILFWLAGFNFDERGPVFAIWGSLIVIFGVFFWQTGCELDWKEKENE